MNCELRTPLRVFQAFFDKKHVIHFALRVFLLFATCFRADFREIARKTYLVTCFRADFQEITRKSFSATCFLSDFREKARNGSSQKKT